MNRSARVSDVAHGGQVVGTQELVDFLEREKDKHPALQGLVKSCHASASCFMHIHGHVHIHTPCE